MIDYGKIENFSKKLISKYSPQKVVLFGSYANKQANEDSDVDMLVVLPFNGKSVDKAVEMKLSLKPDFPLDLIVKTPEYIEERLVLGDFFIEDILKDGKVIYETNNK